MRTMHKFAECFYAFQFLFEKFNCHFCGLFNIPVYKPIRYLGYTHGPYSDLPACAANSSAYFFLRNAIFFKFSYLYHFSTMDREKKQA